MTAARAGDKVDVAGYEYILWSQAPGAGRWYATRESNGEQLVRVLSVRSGRWTVANGWFTPKLPVRDTEPKAVARTSDPSTSKAAAVAAAPRTGTQKARLLAAYRDAPVAEAVGCLATGYTDLEAARECGLEHIGYWKRCSDLRNDGFIAPLRHESGNLVIRYTPNGDANMVCAITDSGLAALPPALEPHVRTADPVPVPTFHHHFGPTSASCPACGAGEYDHYGEDL